MITSRRRHTLPLASETAKRITKSASRIASAVIVLGVITSNLNAWAQNSSRFEGQRIDVSHAQPVRAVAVARPVFDDASERNGGQSPKQSAVQPVGYFHGGCDGGCGPVCDCGTYMEPGCGLEPGCGIEPGCGLEPGCGFEPGCGLEGLGPMGCGAVGCDSFGCHGCGEVSCGAESGPCGCDSCSGTAGRYGQLNFCVPVLYIAWQRIELFAGVQGFRGPMNFATVNAAGERRGDGGNFGFYEGFNEGRSLSWLNGWDMAWQWGLRATQANLGGTGFSDETRHQIFMTSGLFRRVDYGFQYGVVVDNLYDDWYYQAHLTQIRTELSWKTQGPHTVGFQFMASSGSDSSNTSVTNTSGTAFSENITFEATNQYRFFYRQLFGNRGSCDVFGGWTDNSDALMGMLADIPVGPRLSFNTGATYLSASENDLANEPEQESWNLSIGFTFRPGGLGGCHRHSRPMFNVADNGTFMVDRR
ncbi:DUF6666 family protein [Stieleria varia]|nr:DUF6666 family protein [Stieleria varia]